MYTQTIVLTSDSKGYGSGAGWPLVTGHCDVVVSSVRRLEVSDGQARVGQRAAAGDRAERKALVVGWIGGLVDKIRGSIDGKG